MTERDDTPAIQGAIRRAHDFPGEPARIDGTDVTVTWRSWQIDGIRAGDLVFSPGTLYLGSEDRRRDERREAPSPVS